MFVANASSDKIPGLASWGQRVVANLGLDVFEVDNSDVKLTENTLITENYDLKTFIALKKTFDIKNVILLSDITDKTGYNQQVFRSEVSLLLVGN